MIAPLRPILRLTDGGIVTQLYRFLGGAPKPLVRRAFQLSSGTKLITKPLATLQHLDDAEWLAQIEAVDRFTANMIAYPGRTFGQLYHRMIKHNQLLTGKVNLSGHEIDISTITAAGADLRRQHRRHRADQRRQAAGRPAAQRPRGALRDRARRPPRHAHRPGRAGHHVAHDGRVDRAVLHARREAAAGGRQEGSQEGRRPRSRPKKPATKPAAAGRPAAAGADADSAAAPDRSAIGSNPERRFASAASRNLHRKP